MRVLHRAFSLALGLALSGGAAAAEIVSAPAGMALAKSHPFTAVPSVAGATVTWTVDRITSSESNGGSVSTKLNVLRATGTNPSFRLSKVDRKQTIWRINATDNGITDTVEVQVFPADKLSSFTYASTGNPTVRTYIVVPSGVSDQSKLLVVMHGASRNPTDYCSYWRTWAINKKRVLACPLFTESSWPGGRGYNRGNVFANDADTVLNPESKWAYTVVDKIQKRIRDGFALDADTFDFWGHSAGGQFIERFLLFKPDAKVGLAMMANPGWYMLPSLSTAYQCGAKHTQLNFTEADMQEFIARPNTLLFSGTADTDPNDPETGGCMDAQGKGRYARAGYFYAYLKTQNADTPWLKIDVPGVAHEGDKMAKATQNYLDSH